MGDARPGEDDLEPHRSEPALAGREGDRVAHRPQRRGHAVDFEPQVAGDRAGVRSGVDAAAPCLERRDLRHVGTYSGSDPANRSPPAVRIPREMTTVAIPVVALPRPTPKRPMPRDHAHLSDEALVALVARGDEASLGELYDRVGRVAYRLAHRVLRDDRLAEDAVQEGFLAVWRTAAAFRPERGKASSWILTLVHRRAVDLVRREERRRSEPLDDDARDAVLDVSAEQEAWVTLERERVQGALLPETQREAIELAYYGGFSQSELAARLGVPLGTIKSRMFAGLTRLRELLDDGAGAS
jgi:RNA polymerase sigma factor (sigma-70 family)